MPNIERLFQQGLDAVAQRLGLRPKRFLTEDEAIDITIEKFLDGGPPGQVLELPPEETGKDTPDSAEDS